jgi:hypothetical protein
LVPHALVVLPVKHTCAPPLAEQQPLHEFESQMHAPCEQRRPLPHGIPPSQLQAPALVQESATKLFWLQLVQEPPLLPQ